MKTLWIAQLVFDFSLYPRVEIDSQHVHYIRQAIKAGLKLPPIIIDKASKRIIDGMHRARAYRLEYGDDYKIQVEERTYDSEAAMFIEAMRLNAAHGRMLTTYDRAHCVLHAEQLKIEPEQIAEALHVTTEVIGKLRRDRTGRLHAKAARGQSIPLKRTLRHKAGQQLTERQQAVNKKLGGMEQLFYANQLIMLFENDLVDVGNEQLVQALRHLGRLIRQAKLAAA
jgi:hypothetical protein